MAGASVPSVAVPAHGVLHILLELVGGVVLKLRKVRPRWNGCRPRRLHLRLRLRGGRHGRRRLRLWLNRRLLDRRRGRSRWRLALPLQLFLLQLVKGLLINLWLTQQRLDRLGPRHKGCIEIGKVLMVLKIGGLDGRRQSEQVFGNEEKREEQQDVKENGPQNALAQPRPAPLILKLADHLQQFVGVVVDPARGAAGAGAVACSGWGRGGLRPLASSCRIRLLLDVHWRFAGGHLLLGNLVGHTCLARLFGTSLFSHRSGIRANPDPYNGS